MRNYLLLVFASALVLPVLALGQQSAGNDPFAATRVVQNENPALSVWQIPSRKNIIGMGYILQTRDGKIGVIDGGYEQDVEFLLELVKRITGQKKAHIDAWFLTHCHADHVQGLCALIEKNKIPEIGALYYSFPPRDWVINADEKGADEARYIYQWLPKIPHTETRANMKIQLGNVSIAVLNDYYINTKNPYNNHQDINNTSIVYRVETGQTSILFLGDLVRDAGDLILKNQPTEKIKADIVQVSHHGQAGVDENFYRQVNPSICLWPTPEGIWKAAPLKKKEWLWFENMNVPQQFSACRDGLIKLELK